MSGRLYTFAIALELVRRQINARYYPRRAEAMIDHEITRRGLEGTGFDPSWVEKRRAEREAKAARRGVARG